MFGAFLKVNKKIVDENTIITQDEAGEDISSEEVVDFKEDGYDNEIKVSVVGDILFDGHIRNNISQEGYDYPWVHVKEYFQNDDITIGNLETSVTRGGTPCQINNLISDQIPKM